MNNVYDIIILLVCYKDLLSYNCWVIDIFETCQFKMNTFMEEHNLG